MSDKRVEVPSDPGEAKHPEHPEIGKVNALEIAIGLRGFGKSTLLAERCFQLSAEWGGAYVIGHSLGARMPDKLPDGTKLPIRYYATLRDLENGLQSHPGDWHILVGGSADPVIHYARALSEAIRAKAWFDEGNWSRWNITKRMDGIHAVPVIIIIDEMIALNAAGGKTQGTKETEWFREWVFSLRHEHTALLAGIQNAAARSWLMVEQATRIYAVKARHAWALELLRAAGATQDQLDNVRVADVGEIEVIE